MQNQSDIVNCSSRSLDILDVIEQTPIHSYRNILISTNQDTRPVNQSEINQSEQNILSKEDKILFEKYLKYVLYKDYIEEIPETKISLDNHDYYESSDGKYIKIYVDPEIFWYKYTINISNILSNEWYEFIKKFIYVDLRNKPSYEELLYSQYNTIIENHELLDKELLYKKINIPVAKSPIINNLILNLIDYMIKYNNKLRADSLLNELLNKESSSDISGYEFPLCIIKEKKYAKVSYHDNFTTNYEFYIIIRKILCEIIDIKNKLNPKQIKDNYILFNEYINIEKYLNNLLSRIIINIELLISFIESTTGNRNANKYLMDLFKEKIQIYKSKVWANNSKKYYNPKYSYEYLCTEKECIFIQIMQRNYKFPRIENIIKTK
jgi:hypothetical protein